MVRICQPRTDSGGKWKLAGFGRESPLFAESFGILWRLWILEAFLCRALKVDGRWNKFIYCYLIPQLNLLSICTCRSSLVCIPVMCSFSFIFLGGLSYCRVPKIWYPIKSIEIQRNGDSYSMYRLMRITLEGVMTIWCSDTSLGWSLYPCRCSQMHVGSSNFYVSWGLFCNSAFPGRERHANRTALSQQWAVLLSSVQDLPSPH